MGARLARHFWLTPCNRGPRSRCSPREGSGWGFMAHSERIGRSEASGAPHASSSRLLSVGRRLAIHYVKVVAGAKDDCTIRDLPGAQFCDLRGSVTFCHSLRDLEVLHVDVDSLIARELPNHILCA